MICRSFLDERCGHSLRSEQNSGLLVDLNKFIPDTAQVAAATAWCAGLGRRVLRTSVVDGRCCGRSVAWMMLLLLMWEHWNCDKWLLATTVRTTMARAKRQNVCSEDLRPATKSANRWVFLCVCLLRAWTKLSAARWASCAYVLRKSTTVSGSGQMITWFAITVAWETFIAFQLTTDKVDFVSPTVWTCACACAGQGRI